jgi:hypothetical protein
MLSSYRGIPKGLSTHDILFRGLHDLNSIFGHVGCCRDIASWKRVYQVSGTLEDALEIKADDKARPVQELRSRLI